MWRSWRWRSSLSKVVALVCVASGIEAQPTSRNLPEFRGAVDVREREIFFDASSLPEFEALGRLSDVDFLVLEDGNPRQLLRRSGGDEKRALRHLLWFDETLAAPRALAEAARHLLGALPELTATGSVTIAQVGPRDLSIARDLAEPEARQLLRALAGRWGRVLPREALALDCRRLAIDRLAVEIAELDAGDRGAVWLAVEGWRVGAFDLEGLETVADRGGDRSELADTLERTGRILASHGWTLFSVVGRAPPDPTRALRSAREEEMRPTLRETARPPIFYLFRFHFPRRRVPPAARTLAAVELATDLDLIPLGRLARSTSGALVGDAGAIVERATRWAGRRRLAVSEPETQPGSLRKLEVVWSGGDGRALPVEPWVRTGSPPDLAAARLAALASGRLLAALGRPVRMVSDESVTGSPRRLCLEDGEGHELLRLSRWRSGEGHPEIGEPRETSPNGAPCLPFPGDRMPGDVLLLEDADTGAWGAVGPL